MRSKNSATMRRLVSGLLAGLVMTSGAVFAGTTTVNLTAQRSSTTLPDGNTVPMWGFCSADASPLTGGATLTGGACAGTGWTPGPTITIPYDASGTSLTINLTNNLPTPTSLVILGQLGGGLGSPNKEASPAHATQNITWPAAGNPGDPQFIPPVQGLRARSFSPEAALNGGTQTYTWNKLKPGTYLYETGSHPSIQAPMGLYGVLVVTTPPVAASTTTTATPGTAYTAVNYDADATLLFSEIDPKMNAAIDTVAVNTAGCAAVTGSCSGSINEKMYPPAVNYVPTYFLINGRAFDPTALSANAFSVPATATTGNVLVRFANAGLRAHVPTTIGLSMAVIAEDGNLKPGKEALSQLLMPAGKTFDVVVNPATDGAGNYKPGAFGIFDRQLSLSNANQPVGGMQAILQVAGGALPQAMSCAANNDNYTVAVNSSSFSGNVSTNDRGLTALSMATPPANGSVTLNANGSFTYTPNAAPVGSDSFTYTGTCAATAAAFTATVNLNVANMGGAPVANTDTYSSKVASLLTVKTPGVLGNDTDPSNFKLSAVIDNVPAGLTVVLNTDGSFTAQPATLPTTLTNYSFTYKAVNAQGTASAAATVNLTFNPGSGLVVSVLDTVDRTPVAGGDYGWIIEEDQTYFHDPKNPSGSGNGTPPQSLATNFHKSYMPVVAAGCTGPRSCGNSNTGTGISITLPSLPSAVVLDPSKRYYISVLPGDAIDGDQTAGTIGHSMGGASIMPGQTAVTVLTPRNPLPGAQISVIVFEDSGPTNGTIDAGEGGLGNFTINLFDTRGSSGDPAGQMTYDLNNMPLNNSLANTIDKVTGVNLCPLPSPMGVITTCPENGSDGQPSRLAGMALVKNVPPGRYDVLAIPGVERHTKGETWVQVSTLEGTPVNDTFVKAGEPGYWQEFGPAGFHSFIGFVNLEHVKAAGAAIQAIPAAHATNTVTGNISSLHMDRPPAGNLNDSCATAGSVDETCRASLSFTTCQVSINQDTTGNNVSYAACDPNGNFTLTNVPSGTHELVIWDQWLDQIIAKKAVTVPVGDNQNIAVGSIPVFSWFTRIEQTAFQDVNGNGVQDAGEPGLPMIPLNVRFRDGSISNYLATDLVGNGGTNELFPLFNWYVLETDTTRYKGTGVHIVYDAGGKPDTSGPFAGVLNSTETTSLPANLQVPGATYTANSTSRIDPGTVLTEGVQGFINQTAFVEWGKTPYAAGENGGISGMVYFASTRAFDDPRLETQLSWEPGVPRVQVNLYSKTVNADGTESLSLVDNTSTTSWDDNINNMHCPGDPLSDPFVQSTLGAADQFKCYDGQHVFNQIQPAVYDGRYRFPSATYLSAHPAGLPTGKYVVEAVLPDGYEIVKEEDKNVLNGDSWSTVGDTQFAGVGNIFIKPDQATVNDSVNPGSGAAFPPCVGRPHRVPDYLSLFPETLNIAPYAGTDRPLCDRKEVQLNDQMQAAADFQVFTPTQVAAHFTGMMLNDAAAEFDKFSPSFGEKAALPNAPVAFRDYNGVEIGRVYSDKYGTFNGLMPSTWEANVPNPSGYAPNMLTSCMNDPGPIPDPAGTIDPATNQVRMIVDPLYNPQFSNFCYVWPYMAGITTYLDTPVLPVSAFANASSYAPVDCQYPDATPAISRVDGDGIGPWVPSANGNYRVRITALGDVSVPNPAYEGPTALTPPANQPKITRHYGFGATAGSVTVNGVPLTNVVWSDSSITATVPVGVTTGELVITAANGKSSIDSVTLNVGGLAPVVVRPATPQTSLANGLAHPIQDAINAAKPGDLIILDAGHYPELVIMDRPVRLQGVGAASVVINATKFPNQKVADWRDRINTLFGLDDQGNQTGTVLVDPLPGQTVAGIAQIEPSALGSEEGAGITVLAKGLRANGTPLNGNVGANGDCNPASVNYTVHNFRCGSSRIDGVSVTGSDSGGGIYVNGWAHNLEIANNRVYGNAGQFNGGVRIGQPYLDGNTLPAANGGYGYDVNVNIHHNAITTNGTVEGAPGVINGANAGGAGGGLSMCAGSDNYRVTGNWICGNYTSADGGGIGHIGHSRNGLISKNMILFNESFNQTGTQNGGGVVVEGENDGTLTIGSGDVTIDSNLIQGNFARAGHGGGVRLQNINGLDAARARGLRWKVTMTNNMIVNNVAGWSGGGVSMADVLDNNVIANNTIASNDSVGMTGNLFNTMVNGVGTGPATGIPNPAGVSAELTTPALLAQLPQAQRAGNVIANPELINNIVWQNRSFFFDLRPDQNGVNQALVIASSQWTDASAHVGSPLPAQASVGQCVSGASYWDLGVVGDKSPTDAPNGRLEPTYSVLTANIPGYSTTGNVYADPKLALQYCNGTRALPGLQFEPGTPFQPAFNMDAAATLDESGNFVDLHFGPISLTDPSLPGGNTAKFNGDYHLVDMSSPAYNVASATDAPNHDFDGMARPQDGAYDIGADELPSTVTLTPNPVNFGAVQLGQTSATQTVTLTNIGLVDLVLNATNAVTLSGVNANNFAVVAGTTCTDGATIAVSASCVVNLSFTPSASGNRNATLNVNDARGTQSVAITGRGQAPSGAVTPSPLQFGPEQINITSGVRHVTVSNTGVGPLTITTIAIVNPTAGAGFAQTNNCPLAPATLAVGGNCVVNMTFTPTSTGAKTGTLAVTYNLTATTFGQASVTLNSSSGVAVNARVNPTAYSFGDQTVGTANTVTVTVTNNTTTARVLAAPSFTGTGAAAYSVVGGTCAASLAANSSCTRIVQFQPAAAGRFDAVLNDGLPITPNTMTLTGFGI